MAMMVFKSRHFKRTLLVIAIIGGIWYMYVTKNNNNNNNYNSRTKEVRQEDIHPLSLQERMQEVLAAREWLAENSVRMGYNNMAGGGGGGGGGGEGEDPYPPNRLFNNGPPRNYFGGPSPNEGEYGSAWGNLPFRGPFAGGSGDLEKYKHGAHAPSYPDGGQNGGQVPQAQPQYGKASQYEDGRDSIAQAWGNQALNWNRNSESGRPYDSYQEPSFRNSPQKQYPALGNNVYQNQLYNIPQKKTESNMNENSNFEGTNYQQNYPPYSNMNLGPQPNVNQQPDQNLNIGQNLQQAQIPNPSQSTALAQNDNSDLSSDNLEERQESKPKQELSENNRQQPTVNSQQNSPPKPAILNDDKSAQKPPDSPGLQQENLPKPMETVPRANKPPVPGLKPPEPPNSVNTQTKAPIPDHRPQNTAPFQGIKPELRSDSIQAPANEVRKIPNSFQEKPFIPSASNRIPSQGSFPQAPKPGQPILPPPGSNNVMSPGRLPLSNVHLSAVLPPIQKAQPTTTESQNFVKRFLARLLYSDDKEKSFGEAKDGGEVRLPRQKEEHYLGRRSSSPEGSRDAFNAAGKGGVGYENGQQNHEERKTREGNGAEKNAGRGEGRREEDPPRLMDPAQLRPRPEAEERVPNPPPRGSSLNFLPDFFRPGVQRHPQPFTGSRGQSSLQKQQGEDSEQQLRKKHHEEKGDEKGEKGGSNVSPDKKGLPPPPPSSAVDLTTATVVTRDKTHWKEEPCEDKGPLPQGTLNTPFGKVPLYLESGVNDTDAFNNAFGVDWNMHGIGTFFDRCLLPDPNVSLVDIGAGVGPAAFIAARLGRDVFAIEPIEDMVGAMCRTVTDLGYGKVHVIHNAVSDERNKVSFRRGNKNLPTDSYVVDTRNKPKVDPNSPTAFAIRLDDILRLYKITNAAVRLNVASFEGRALAGANKFLNTVNIPCILMEWKHVHSLKDFGGSYVFEVLSNRGFFPHDVNTLRPLKVFRMHEWPAEVLWAKLGSYPVKL
ncbi:uncharacterized protein [Littorina saxatilis]|uniref:Uncharacterized protein n=1 Tax=Littorina saxatilis TaxID=31220 RepID=A0AAN9G5L2_9CAEN